MKSSVAVLIVNWNGRSIIGDALRSIQAQKPKPDQVIVVDNASSDDSVAYIRSNFPYVEIIENTRNLGFAEGVNIGMKMAKGDYVALLNSDASAESGWLKQLVARAQAEPAAAIVAPKVLLPANGKASARRIESAGDVFTRWGIATPRGRGEVDRGQYDQVELVGLASGSSSLYSLKIWRELGGFDERLFMYYEDVDYGLRATQAGYQIWYEPTAVVEHQPGGSSKKRGHLSRYYVLRNSHLVYWKNLRPGTAWRMLPRFLIAQVYMTLGAWRAGAAWPWFKAELSAAWHLPSVMFARHAFQRPLTYKEFANQWPFKKN